MVATTTITIAMTIDHVAKETDVRCYGDGCCENKVLLCTNALLVMGIGGRDTVEGVTACHMILFSVTLLFYLTFP